MTTQPEQAVVGATNDDPVVAVEPTIEDRFADIASEIEPEAPADDSPPVEAEDDIELEADDLPPIQPPVSWPDEDKAAFADMPRELQERVTAREAEREKFVQAKSREAVQARQAADAQAAQQIRQMQDVHIQQLVSLLPEVPGEPTAHLLTQDPAAYADAVDYRNWALQQHASARQQIDAIVAHQQQAEQQQQLIGAQASFELLAKEFPEYIDDAKRPELAVKLRSTGLALGYSDDQLAKTDGWDILALRTASDWKAKADRYDALMAKRMDKVREAKKLPAVSRPGAAQPKGAVANERYQADRQAMRNGDRDAENRVFARFL